MLAGVVGVFDVGALGAVLEPAELEPGAVVGALEAGALGLVGCLASGVELRSQPARPKASAIARVMRVVFMTPVQQSVCPSEAE
jgi:hypothetical protein